jgi:anaerobic selenocysteine-containing dehydrogenase
VTPRRAAGITGLTEAEVEGFAREYATRQPSALRVNYGLNRHAGAGMAVRTIACLPALVGAWRHPGGGLLLSTSGTFPVNNEALERPDLVKPRHAHAEHEPDRPRAHRSHAGPAR